MTCRGKTAFSDWYVADCGSVYHHPPHEVLPYGMEPTLHFRHPAGDQELFTAETARSIVGKTFSLRIHHPAPGLDGGRFRVIQATIVEGGRALDIEAEREVTGT